MGCNWRASVDIYLVDVVVGLGILYLDLLHPNLHIPHHHQFEIKTKLFLLFINMLLVYHCTSTSKLTGFGLPGSFYSRLDHSILDIVLCIN